MANELAGREIDIVWRGRRVHAFVPTLLADRDLTLSARTVASTATAAAEVGHAAEALTGDYEALAHLLLRSEGVASSYIEGIKAPVVDIVLAEEKLAPGGTSAAWVASNLAAVTGAIATAATTSLSVEALCEWHRTLMTGSPTPERYVGVIRGEQSWIGGNDPTNAHLVTPPPDELGPLLEDLVLYANRGDVDPVAQAAIAHAQFETIHPFADGNGRVGRVLVAWALTRRLSLVTPPPVSVAIAADVGGYSSGLVRYRFGRLDDWVQWFADAVRGGGRAQRQLISEVNALKTPSAGATQRRDAPAPQRRRCLGGARPAAPPSRPDDRCALERARGDQQGRARRSATARRERRPAGLRDRGPRPRATVEALRQSGASRFGRIESAALMAHVCVLGH